MTVAFYVWLLVITCGAQETLLSVHVVFRHGARAPVLNVTSEESKIHFYRGLGQLTDEGIEQAKLTGEYLRENYVKRGFIDERMIPSELLFRSSPVERCLMTIETVGAVMFPNATPPVQTVPRGEDYLLLPKMDCPFLIDEYQQFFNLTPAEKEEARRNIWDISERALKKAALQTTQLVDKWDQNIPALILEKDAGLAVPSWFNEKAYSEAKSVFYSALAVMSSVGEYHSARGIRPKSGLLLNNIFKEIRAQVACHQQGGQKCGNRKFQVFSSHDILILSLLESMGLREPALGPNSAPEFLATIIMETWISTEGEPVVKVLYKPHPKRAAVVMTRFVTKCDKFPEFCPVQQFLSCCDDFITSDAKTECYGPGPGIWRMTPISWILIAVCLFLMLLVALLFGVVVRNRSRSSVNLKV